MDAQSKIQVKARNSGVPNSHYLPHIDLLLAAMRIGREGLAGRSKIAVDADLLRALIGVAVARLPFSEAFYRATYPDIAAAHAAGAIPDLHRHFVTTGFFEGRAGAAPDMDDAFYAVTYPDVAQALGSGEVASASEHYVRSGAAEGRAPNAAVKPEIDGWVAMLRETAEAG